MVRFAAVLACLSGMRCVVCRSDAISVQNRLKIVRSVQFACLIGSTANSVQFSLGNGGQVLPFSSFSSVQFTNSSDISLAAMICVIQMTQVAIHQKDKSMAIKVVKWSKNNTT